MPLHISRMLNIINGGGRALFSMSFHGYFSTAASETQKNNLFEHFLIHTIGYSEEEATKALPKVSRLNPLNKDFNSFVDYFKDLGFSKTHIKSIVVTNPRIMFNDLDKTLKPKIQFLQDFGLSGSDLVGVLMGNRTLLGRGLDSHIKPQIEFLRNLLGSDVKVVTALKRCAYLLGYYAPRKIANVVSALQELGFSNEKIAKLFLLNPRAISGLTPKRVAEVGHRLESHIGIPRSSAMFFHGFLVFSSMKESTERLKWTVLRSFGWSDAEIQKLSKNFPYALCLSEARLGRTLSFYMKELGYTSDYLASHSRLFSASLETRVKPRNEVLKILNEKKLIKRKASLYSVVCLSESKFLEDYLLLYKNEIPEVYESYIKMSKKSQIEKH